MATALITGAGGGIGSACARELRKAGFSVLLHYHTSFAAARNLAKEISAPATFKADLRDPAQTANMCDEILNIYGAPDVIVNNAGIAQYKQIQDVTDEEWQDMIAADLSSAFFVTRRFLPEMISRKSGSIINISSIWGQTGGSMEVPYSAAKGGVIAMTKALAKELGPSGIRVNCVAPGIINTSMISRFSEEELSAMAEEVPLGRLGEPEDVAMAVRFLASGDSAYITGQVLAVNGGLAV